MRNFNDIKKDLYKWLKIFLAAQLLLLFCFCVLYFLGIRINTSHSLPPGLWRVERIDPAALVVGDSVAVEEKRIPVAAGYGGKDFLKDVGALSGDVITFSERENSLYRNGERLNFSEICSKDSQGRNIERIEYPVEVPAGHLWLASRHPKGYDSRYFGPVSMDAVLGRATLLWAW